MRWRNSIDLPGSIVTFELLLAFGEDLLAHRVGGEQTVAARVPVGREAGIRRVVEHDDASPAPSPTVPVSMVQRPRVPQTASPLSPSLLVYWPVTPVLSST